MCVCLDLTQIWFSFSASLWKLETGNLKLFLEDAAPRKVIVLAWRQQGCTTYYTETLARGNSRFRSGLAARSAAVNAECGCIGTQLHFYGGRRVIRTAGPFSSV